MALVAVLILMVHLAWLALAIFGAFWTRGRPVCSALHILALLWGIVVEVSPWPCPLTLAEQYFESRAGPSWPWKNQRSTWRDHWFHAFPLRSFNCSLLTKSGRTSRAQEWTQRLLGVASQFHPVKLRRSTWSTCAILRRKAMATLRGSVWLTSYTSRSIVRSIGRRPASTFGRP